MKKLFVLAIIPFMFSCGNSVPEPQLSPDAKAIRDIKIDNFVGDWFYTISGSSEPYKKIIITKEAGNYKFEYYTNYKTGWEHDEYTPAQTLTNKDFTPALESGFTTPTPYITVKILYSARETSIVKYNIKNGVHSLDYDMNDFYKK